MSVPPRASFVFLLLLAAPAEARVPPGYYDTVDATNPTTLRQTLHAIIDDHTRFPYTSSSTDTWDILETAMEDPNNAGNILDVYENASHPKQGGGNSLYNREHSWPKSYGFPDDNSGNYPYTDCHMLFLCDPDYNWSRSNKPFRTCSAGCTEEPTVANNGQGGPGGGYPGNSNWTSGSFTQGTWETWVGRRGDVARAILYADLRYEGGTHGVTGHAEPDLIATDSESLIDSSNTGNNESVGYMGMLQTLLAWHAQDPPDAADVLKNDTVYAFQGNRNPFVDHPEWVDCLYAGVCPSPCPDPIAYGAGELGSTGNVGTTSWSGTPSVSSADLTIEASGFTPNSFAVMFTGTGQGNNPTNGFTILVSGVLTRTIFFTDGNGEGSVPIAIAPAQIGFTRTFQCVGRDPGFGGNVQGGNGVQATFCP